MRCFRGLAEAGYRPLARPRLSVLTMLGGPCGRNLPRPPTERGRRLREGPAASRTAAAAEQVLAAEQAAWLTVPGPKHPLSVVGSHLASQEREALACSPLSPPSWGDGPVRAGCPPCPPSQCNEWCSPGQQWGAAMGSEAR